MFVWALGQEAYHTSHVPPRFPVLLVLQRAPEINAHVRCDPRLSVTEDTEDTTVDGPMVTTIRTMTEPAGGLNVLDATDVPEMGTAFRFGVEASIARVI
jgi:hypothetical protein